jgi:hypothetical protein
MKFGPKNAAHFPWNGLMRNPLHTAHIAGNLRLFSFHLQERGVFGKLPANSFTEKSKEYKNGKD